MRERDDRLCQQCLRDGRLTPIKRRKKGDTAGTVGEVDHKIPLHVRPDLRLDPDAVELLCRSCHARKTAVDDRKYGSASATRLTAQQVANRRAAQDALST